MISVNRAIDLPQGRFTKVKLEQVYITYTSALKRHQTTR